MEQIIIDMVEKAIYYNENLNFIDEAYDLLKFVRDLIEQMASTINCPSNWRDIGEMLMEKYKDNKMVYNELQLWNYE